MQNPWRTNVPLTTSPFRFLLFVSKPHARAALLAMLAVVFAGSLTAAISYTFKTIVNAATALPEGGSYMALVYAALLYIFINLGANLLWRASGFAGMRWATGARATARYALTDYVTRHSYQYFSNRFAGSLANKISHAASGVRDMVNHILWDFLAFVVTVIVSFIIAFITSPIISLIFLAWAFVITPLNVYLARRRVPISAATQKAETALTGATVDILTNITATHEYAARGFELSRLTGLIVRRWNSGLRNWKYGEWVLVVNNVLQAVFIGGIIMTAIYLASQGTITAGDIILLLTIIVFVEDRLTHIGNQLNQFGDTWGEITESLSELLEPHDVADRPDAIELSVTKGGVLFDKVWFDYGGVAVFEGLTLPIPAGEKVGLVGRSGAGKTTLMKLVLRHYDLSGGRILIDGVDIATITKDSLREAIAVVPQEPLLFHRSIAENIAYGKPKVSRREVEHAAELAQAHEFIQRLPEGYESLVGERGVKLSGGQRQRVAIARAILKDAPILLLDEATSSLDSESEVAVQKALLTLMEGRTVIAIAHRLSTLRAMDRIIVMDGGTIVEDGTHDELLKQKGLYADLWSHQSGGYLEDE